jgi:hypothetical protein
MGYSVTSLNLSLLMRSALPSNENKISHRWRRRA